MSSDIDKTVDQLDVVTSGESLDNVPVAAVDENGPDVTLTLKLPSGDTFTESFTMPPVWGANCDLKRLLDSFDLGPDEIDDLVGKQLSCDRTVTDSGLDFFVDRELL